MVYCNYGYHPTLSSSKFTVSNRSSLCKTKQSESRSVSKVHSRMPFSRTSPIVGIVNLVANTISSGKPLTAITMATQHLLPMIILIETRFLSTQAVIMSVRSVLKRGSIACVSGLPKRRKRYEEHFQKGKSLIDRIWRSHQLTSGS